MNIVKDLIDKAKTWTGYLEKASSRDLDNFTANAGSNNYTCFARDYYKHTGGNYQGQAWCAMFVSEVFVQQFGLESAKKMLGGALYHYCPTGVNQFKTAGRWYKSPEPGDVIFFTNGSRAYHTGIVTEVTSSRVKTIEGNTSGASGVIANGGGVCQKSYSLVDSKIMGYGRPHWNAASPPKSGWVKEGGNWRFYLDDTGTYIKNDWYKDEDKWYWFDGAGIMVTNTWYQYKGNWYYMGSDGAMVIGLQMINGNWYYMDQEGKMTTKPVILTPDRNGALQYP